MRASAIWLLSGLLSLASFQAEAASRTFDLTASRFQYDVSPGGAIIVDQGDVVTLRITAVDTTHGFAMETYVSPPKTLTLNNTVTVTFTAHTAGSFTYFCTRVCGEGHSTMNGTMVVVAATTPLAINDVEPGGGSTAGGTSVTISGSGFETGATVKFDASQASNVIVQSSSTITAVTPAHPPGKVSVTVTNPGDESATLGNAYTYANAPSLDSIEPDSGPSGGGTTVTVSGSNFQSGAAVRFGSKLATGVAVPNSGTITAKTPSNPAGAVDVTVTNPDLQSDVLDDGFSYVAAPVITAVSPNQGNVAGGTQVTLSGSGFRSGAVVTFDSLFASGVVVASESAITAITPAHAPGSVDVTVTNPDSQSHTRSGGFTYVTGPAIASIAPGSGPSAGGTRVTISGSGFQNGATVTFGGFLATETVALSTTVIETTTPAHEPGVVDVTVTNPDAQSSTLDGAFAYSLMSATGIVPTFGSVTGGTPFILSGSGFVEGAAVLFDGFEATSVVVESSNTITGLTPPHPAGSVDIAVRNPNNDTATLENGYTYSASSRRRPVNRPNADGKR